MSKFRVFGLKRIWQIQKIRIGIILYVCLQLDLLDLSIENENSYKSHCKVHMCFDVAASSGAVAVASRASSRMLNTLAAL